MFSRITGYLSSLVPEQPILHTSCCTGPDGVYRVKAETQGTSKLKLSFAREVPKGPSLYPGRDDAIVTSHGFSSSSFAISLRDFSASGRQASIFYQSHSGDIYECRPKDRNKVYKVDTVSSKGPSAPREGTSLAAIAAGAVGFLFYQSKDKHIYYVVHNRDQWSRPSRLTSPSEILSNTGIAAVHWMDATSNRANIGLAFAPSSNRLSVYSMGFPQRELIAPLPPFAPIADWTVSTNIGGPLAAAHIRYQRSGGYGDRFCIYGQCADDPDSLFEASADIYARKFIRQNFYKFSFSRPRAVKNDPFWKPVLSSIGVTYPSEGSDAYVVYSTPEGNVITQIIVNPAKAQNSPLNSEVGHDDSDGSSSVEGQDTPKTPGAPSSHNLPDHGHAANVDLVSSSSPYSGATSRSYSDGKDTDANALLEKAQGTQVAPLGYSLPPGLGSHESLAQRILASKPSASRDSSNLSLDSRTASSSETPSQELSASKCRTQGTSPPIANALHPTRSSLQKLDTEFPHKTGPTLRDAIGSPLSASSPGMEAYYTPIETSISPANPAGPIEGISRPGSDSSASTAASEASHLSYEQQQGSESEPDRTDALRRIQIHKHVDVVARTSDLRSSQAGEELFRTLRSSGCASLTSRGSVGALRPVFGYGELTWAADSPVQKTSSKSRSPTTFFGHMIPLSLPPSKKNKGLYLDLDFLHTGGGSEESLSGVITSPTSTKDDLRALNFELDHGHPFGLDDLLLEVAKGLVAINEVEAKYIVKILTNASSSADLSAKNIGQRLISKFLAHFHISS